MPGVGSLQLGQLTIVPPGNISGIFLLDKTIDEDNNLSMLLGHHQFPETYSPLLKNPVWHQALNWISNIPADLPLGEHEINGRDMFVNYHEAQLLPREEGTYEAHQNYIDLHYCLTGGEIIEWVPVATLTSTTQYNAEKDYQLYAVPPQASSCLMTPGTFAVFFPGDAHMPKVSDGKNTKVKKVVVKIKLSLLK